MFTKLSVSLEVFSIFCHLDNFPRGITSSLGSASQTAAWPQSCCHAACAGGGCGHCPWGCGALGFPTSSRFPACGLYQRSCTAHHEGLCTAPGQALLSLTLRPLEITGIQNNKLMGDLCWTELLGCVGQTGAERGSAKTLQDSPVPPLVSAWVKAAVLCASVYHQELPF